MATLKEFLESTRGDIASRLRQGAQTVDDLASALGLTDNAIRAHLSKLERDGVVRPVGVRRAGGVGKPAVLYDLHPDADVLFSKAYPPMLGALLDVMTTELPHRTVEAVLRETGRRLAAGSGGAAVGRLEARVERAADALRTLGGDVTVKKQGRGFRIESAGCPLGAVVTRSPTCCMAVESLVESIVGAPVQECCSREGRPKCSFSVGRV